MKISKKLQDVYEQSRTLLESFFRKKISSMNNLDGLNSTKNSKSINIVKVTQDHDEKLCRLRELYEKEIKYLEKVLNFNYSIEFNLIKTLEDTLNSGILTSASKNNKVIPIQNESNAIIS